MWPPEFRQPRDFQTVLDRALSEAKGVVVRNDAEGELSSPDDLRFLLAYPIRLQDKVHGVAALQITSRSQAASDLRSPGAARRHRRVRDPR